MSQHSGDLSDEIAQQWDALYATAIHWASGRVEVAEDLVQSAMVRALRYKDRFQRGTNLRAWMTTIMKRLWFDQLRAQKREGQTVSLDALSDQGAEAPIDMLASPERLDDAVVAKLGIEDALSEIATEMPPYYLEVMKLVVLQDLTYYQAADRVGVPVGSAFSATFRARRRLVAGAGSYGG